MNDFVHKLILAYIKSKGSNYSLAELVSILGLTISNTLEEIQFLVASGHLEVNENILSITLSGRLAIQNEDVDHMTFNIDDTIPINADLNSAWPLDKIYVPKNFLKKLKPT